MKNDTQNLAAAYKELKGGEVLKTTISGGAGDAMLSPCMSYGHTPALALGAVHTSTHSLPGGQTYQSTAKAVLSDRLK